MGIQRSKRVQQVTVTVRREYLLVPDDRWEAWIEPDGAKWVIWFHNKATHALFTMTYGNRGQYRRQRKTYASRNGAIMAGTRELKRLIAIGKSVHQERSARCLGS